MKHDSITKIRIIKVLEILKMETDEDHYISSIDILNKLEMLNIKCDRRTLYDDINLLINNDYDIIIKKECGKPNYYCLIHSDYAISEIQVLMDAIQASTFISNSQSKTLIDKLGNLCGQQKADILKSNNIFFNNPKTLNDKIMYYVNEIVNAIEKKKKISFNYFDYDISHNKIYRNNHKTYYINPLATVFSEDNYYLIGYYKRYATQTIHFRIDRMDNVEMTDQDQDAFEGQTIDFQNRKKQIFGMFQGEDVEVSFEIDKSILDIVFDKFGQDITLLNSNDNKIIFTATVQLSPTFYAWCFMLGDKLRIIKPDKVIDEYLTKINLVYQNLKKKKKHMIKSYVQAKKNTLQQGFPLYMGEFVKLICTRYAKYNNSIS